MSEMRKLVNLASKPGVKRDGTDLESDFYNDAQHCRFQRGRPRKMGGYRQMTSGFAGLSRGMFISNQTGTVNVHTGSSSKLEACQFDSTGVGAGIIDRTPTSFATNTSYIWTMDVMYDPTGTSTALLFAMAAPSLASIDDETNVQLYYGNANSLSSALTAMPAPGSSTKGPAQVSGGVLSTPPYLWVYGNNGYVQWSVPGSPTNFYDSGTGSANVTNQKIVCGAATRGGPSQSPSGLFWSLDSLIRFGYVGSTAVFRFDTISNQISIMSNKCVVEYDGIYYWPGTDRFYGYNGVVTPLPNNLNRNYFYENLNLAQRQKVWGMKVPAFNEIWWFYPFGTATECTNAVIYNVAENTWYDTALARCAGFYNPIFGFPTMFDTDSSYRIWQHEYGVDQIVNNTIQAIPSWFETANMSFVDEGPMREGWVGGDKWIRCIRVEPDFVQTGALTMDVIGRKYAQSSSWTDSFPVPEGTEKIDVGKGSSQSGQHRIMSIKFTSNVIDGDYQLGESLALVDVGDGRQ